MIDAMDADTLPPPPFQPSAEAVYIIDELRLELCRELSKLHKLLDDQADDARALADRVVDAAVGLERKLKKLESRIDDLEQPKGAP